MSENALTPVQALTLLIKYVDSLVSNPVRQALTNIVSKHIRQTGDNDASIAELKAIVNRELDRMLSDREIVTKLAGFTIPSQPVWNNAGLTGCNIPAALRRLDSTLESGAKTRQTVSKLVREEKITELLPITVVSDDVSDVSLKVA